MTPPIPVPVHYVLALNLKLPNARDEQLEIGWYREDKI